MLDITNVRVPLDAWVPKADTQGFLRKAAARHLRVKPAEIGSVALCRRGIDARRKSDVHFVCTLAVALCDAVAEKRLLARAQAGDKGLAGVREHVPYAPLLPPTWPDGALRPVVVGTGPAGLFAALYLAKAGAKPLVVERGECVEDRSRTVGAFNNGAPLDPTSNVQFGEGGAGTFSDGKLSTNTKNVRIAHVLRWFVDAGAPEEILWEAHPHIGSDKLPGVVAAMRRAIVELGGEVRFRTRLADIRLEGGRLAGAELVGADGAHEIVSADRLVLACGHSARDTFEMLLERGLTMQPKPFSVGVRIEHLQRDVNRAQWGPAADHPALGAAEYKLVEHLKGDDPRNVYSFCMCPGGTVVCAASEEGGVVVNGMSNHARDGRNANAALLVGVSPDDFGYDGPLGGVRFQRDIEQAAYELAVKNGGRPHEAPAQTVGAFLAAGTHGGARPPHAHRGGDAVEPTYARGTVACDLHECLPPFVSRALEQAIPRLDCKLAGFANPAAVMTAPETRSSSPVRILRADDFQAVLRAGIIGEIEQGATGIYPCGEGPGYAGGITSAAVDGLKVAEALVAQARMAAGLPDA